MSNIHKILLRLKAQAPNQFEIFCNIFTQSIVTCYCYQIIFDFRMKKERKKRRKKEKEKKKKIIFDIRNEK